MITVEFSYRGFHAVEAALDRAIEEALKVWPTLLAEDMIAEQTKLRLALANSEQAKEYALWLEEWQGEDEDFEMVEDEEG